MTCRIIFSQVSSFRLIVACLLFLYSILLFFFVALAFWRMRVAHFLFLLANCIIIWRFRILWISIVRGFIIFINFFKPLGLTMIITCKLILNLSTYYLPKGRSLSIWFIVKVPSFRYKCFNSLLKRSSWNFDFNYFRE